MTKVSRLSLSHADRSSPLWRNVETYLNERIQLLREQNDADRSPEDTAKQRGRIAELKSLLDMARPNEHRDFPAAGI